ncbi:hypothetical protein ACLESD_24825 [Pyxidicoccus sp. 3LFB2]
MMSGRCSAVFSAVLSFGVVVSLLAAPGAQAAESLPILGQVILERRAVADAAVMLIRLKDNQVVDQGVSDEKGVFTLRAPDSETYRVLAVTRTEEARWSWTHERIIPSSKGTRVTLQLGPMKLSQTAPESNAEGSWQCERIMTFYVMGTWISQWHCTDTCGSTALSWDEFNEWEG